MADLGSSSVLTNVTADGSKLHEHTDYLLGGYMTAIAVLSIMLNGLVLVTMCRRDRSFTPLDIYIFNLALCDFCHGLIAHPLMATSSFLHRWPLGHTGCHVYSAVVFFLGTNDISILTAICITRYIITCHQQKAHYITTRTVLLSLVPIYSNGLVWSVAPLLGWGRYAVEPFGLSCSLDWPIIPWTYTVSIFAFCYVVPLIFLVICYINIVKHVKSAVGNQRVLKSSSRSLYVTKITSLMCVCFFLAWTPYTIVSFLYLCHASQSVPHFAAVAAPFFAKSSTLYNPLVYFLAVKRFRQDAQNLLLSCLYGSDAASYRRAPVRSEVIVNYRAGSGELSYELRAKRGSADTQQSTVYCAMDVRRKSQLAVSEYKKLKMLDP